MTARGVLGAGEEVGELLLVRHRARAALDLRDGAVDLHGARVEAGLEAVLGEVAGVRVDLLLGAVVRVLDAARGVGVVEFGLGVVVVGGVVVSCGNGRTEAGRWGCDGADGGDEVSESADSR